MPSYLNEYESSSKDRVNKFYRAVESFLKQDYVQKELVVISDGCDITDEVVKKYKNNENIKHIRVEKTGAFIGSVRQEGIINSTGELICYLDTDDFLGETNHLSNIVSVFTENDVDWFYMNDYFGDGVHIDGVMKTMLSFGVIGTSSIAHKKDIKATWLNCDGWGHDWTFINKLMQEHPKYIKFNAGSYRICHMKNLFEV